MTSCSWVLDRNSRGSDDIIRCPEHGRSASPPVIKNPTDGARKAGPLAARNPSRRLAVVVLAAGKGKRMKSGRPKVLHSVCGRPSLWHVLKAALAGRPAKTVVVVHTEAQDVEAAVRSWGLVP